MRVEVRVRVGAGVGVGVGVGVGDIEEIYGRYRVAFSLRADASCIPLYLPCISPISRQYLAYISLYLAFSLRAEVSISGILKPPKEGA